MNVHERRLTVPGMLEQVRKACDFIAEVAESAGLTDEGVYRCVLSAEEICTNIVEHGYEFDGADKTIEIVFQYNAEKLTIIFIDEAPEFNPLEIASPDPNTPLWEREGGGWGIYFVKQYMDDVRYLYKNNRNHLIIEKRL